MKNPTAGAGTLLVRNFALNKNNVGVGNFGSQDFFWVSNRDQHLLDQVRPGIKIIVEKRAGYREARCIGVCPDEHGCASKAEVSSFDLDDPEKLHEEDLPLLKMLLEQDELLRCLAARIQKAPDKESQNAAIEHFLALLTAHSAVIRRMG